MTGTAGSEARSGGPGVTAPVETEGFGDAHTIAEPLTLFLRQTGDVRFLPVGPRALLVELDDTAAARSLAAWVRDRRIEAVEVVPAARTVLLDGVRDLASTRDAVTGWDADRPEPAGGGLVEIPVRYDGPDLAFVAAHWGSSEEDVVAAHGRIEFVASFCGFAPGFAYLSGLPEERAVPRLDSPRARVPAGAVALAGTWCGVYPTASPGGWRILGHTDVVLWDADRSEPALLPPGTRVRFVAAT